MSFVTGNVVSNPKGDLFVVADRGGKKLIPFSYRNSSTYPPEETVYRPWEGRGSFIYKSKGVGEVEKCVVQMYGIDDYTYEAGTIDEFLMKRVREMLKLNKPVVV